MDQNKLDKLNNNSYIIGINVGVLAIYTVISKLVSGGFILDAFLIAIQFIACIIIAISVQKWIWTLSAFVVLLIGFSTCVEFLSDSI